MCLVPTPIVPALGDEGRRIKLEAKGRKDLVSETKWNRESVHLPGFEGAHDSDNSRNTEEALFLTFPRDEMWSARSGGPHSFRWKESRGPGGGVVGEEEEEGQF